MLLATDTATQIMSLALHNRREVLGEQTWQGSENPTEDLAPAVEALLSRCDVKLNQLAALAVSTGPGTYGELRAGMALAKGLASSRGLPLVGMTSLDIIAAGAPYFQGGLIVAVGVGRGRIAVGRYQWKKGRWGGRGDAQLMTWDTLFDSVDGTAYLSGEIDDEGQSALAIAQANDVPITLIPAAYRLRRAGFLAEEAWARLKDSKSTDFPAAKLKPVELKAASESAAL
jgi:tRNA threonylcarbamoyladenosine biosynthesis protein TsaB